MKELSSEEINELINGVIKEIFSNANVENQKSFVKLINHFKNFPDCIYFIENSPLYDFLNCNGDICYYDNDFVPFIKVYMNSCGFNLIATDEFKEYLQSDLFLKTFYEMVYCLLK